VKVGVSANFEERIETLNEQLYAGSDEWAGEWFIEDCPGAGRIEILMHKKLRDYRVEDQYLKGGVLQDTIEVYDCSVEQAKQAMDEAYWEVN